jgi:hypothetical protein
MQVKKAIFAAAHECVSFGGVEARRPCDQPLEAMLSSPPGPRELVVRSRAREDGPVAVAVKDVGVGIAP